MQPTPFAFNDESLWTPTATRKEQTPQTESETETAESYQTAPQLSEPTERFFEALLKREPKPETEIRTIEMVQPEKDVEMKEENAPRPTELKLKQPASFTGKRDELDDFLQDILLYLGVNDGIYDTDRKKIGYALTFMDKGDAKSWKTAFLQNATTGAGLDLGTWTAFVAKLKEDFKPYDAPGDALEELIALKMGNNSIEDHIARYKVLLKKSQVPDDSPSAIDYFRKTLNLPLQRKLLELATPPTDLKGWYEWASRLDNNYRKLQRILNRSTGRFPDKKEEPRRRWTFQKKERDPNAMDVDALSIEKRNEMMKKGLCFGCEKPGHLNKDCPNKRKPATSSNTAPPSYSPPKKMGAKELYTHIRSLTALMNQDEKDEFYKEAEEEGF